MYCNGRNCKKGHSYGTDPREIVNDFLFFAGYLNGKGFAKLTVPF